MATTGDAHTAHRPAGMLGFTLVWAGQLVSVLASNMTQFALTVWVFEKTGSATAMGAMESAFLGPFLALAPIAGAMVDRYSRKLMMMVSDLAAVTATAGILILHTTGQLEVWHLYVAAVLNGLGNTFQWPAYSAAISTMVPKQHYSRANGMMSLMGSGPLVVSPMLAGALLPLIGLAGILTLDVVTFCLALALLLVVFVPQPAVTVEGQAGRGTLLREAAYGFQYIFARRGLLGLLLFFLALNVCLGLTYPIFAPYILVQTDNSTAALGAAQSAWAIGAVIGGLLIGLWGGFKRRIYSIFLGQAWMAVFGLILLGLGRSLPVWVTAVALGTIAFPFVNGASQAIWQSKVAPDVQGRVFSARRMIEWFTDPITPLLAGALADYVTEPAMRGATPLSAAFGWLVGSAPGAGIALQFVLAGVAYLVIVLGVLAFVPAVRDLEDHLPDHDSGAAALPGGPLTAIGEGAGAVQAADPAAGLRAAGP